MQIGSIKEENGHKRKLSETLVVSLRIGSAALRKVTVLVCFSDAVIKHSAKPTQREKDWIQLMSYSLSLKEVQEETQVTVC